MERAIRIGCLVLLGATPASAIDGVREIHHVCATTTGCFAGDAPGYPVEVATGGSYRLTSDLVVPAATNGLVLANDVSLDLNGFSIRGPVLCNPCFATGAGSAVVPATLGGARCTVRNGRIRGFGLDGVALGTQARIEGLTLRDVARHGIQVGDGSGVAETLVDRVGGSGIVFAPAVLGLPTLGSSYRDTVVANVGQVGGLGGQSVSGGRATGGNACSDRRCGTRGVPFFYLTLDAHDGAAADTACAPGFHMASLFEVHDLGNVEYDTSRGRIRDDSGEGPPAGATGWIRSGGDAASGGPPGTRNCLGWTSSQLLETGSVSGLVTWWEDAPFQPYSVLPWTGTLEPSPPPLPLDACSGGRPVWCVQD